MRYLFLLITTLLIVVACKKDCTRPAQCSEKPEAGPCEALITKYYFDKDSGKCKEFTWGGCDGNVPNDTMEECWECECDKRLK